MENVIPSASPAYSECYISSCGSDIALSIWEPPAPLASLVFIPATMVHPLFYETLLGAFAEAGFAVIGLHPVGHGKSPRNVKRYTLDDIIQNGRDAVTYAMERYALPVLLMGSSQGGIAAAGLASVDRRVAAVFAHNIILTELSDSITILKLPRWIRFIYKPALNFVKICAKLLPDVSIPLGLYLDRSRISTNPDLWEKIVADNLCLTHYPLHFISSLFTARFPGLTDGSLHCPVYVIADKGDKLFTPDYTNLVFSRIKAPRKEMVEFSFNDHMLMVTHPFEVCDRLSAIMRAV